MRGLKKERKKENMLKKERKKKERQKERNILKKRKNEGTNEKYRKQSNLLEIIEPVTQQLISKSGNSKKSPINNHTLALY